jgi:hypothetical protein
MYEPSRGQRILAVVAAVSAAIAATLHVVGGTAVEQVTGVSVGVAAAAALGVLYVHGQRRDTDGGDDNDDIDDGTERRQKEMEAEAGGYGGNAGH